MSEVTRILSAIEQGDPHAAGQLLPLVYEELRQLAAQELAHEPPGRTLQATALVHEAYLRLVDVAQAQEWTSRGHFFAAAAEAMRRILVENARRKHAVKRGGSRQRVPLEEFHRVTESPEDLLDLDDALTRFAADEPDKARLVQLRFFAGLSTQDAAAALGISVAAAERWWTFARAWLYSELQGGEKNLPIREGGGPDFSHCKQSRSESSSGVSSTDAAETLLIPRAGCAAQRGKEL
jgi:RNA polymerase sigma factor (TIGR02999 family)